MLLNSFRSAYCFPYETMAQVDDVFDGDWSVYSCHEILTNHIQDRQVRRGRHSCYGVVKAKHLLNNPEYYN